MKNILFLIPLIIKIAQFQAATCQVPVADAATISIYPQMYDKAFPNPLKGFRTSTLKAEDYPTMTRLYIKWNEIENDEYDGVEKILDYCNRQWKDLPERNVKVIPRVYLEWPYNKQNASNTRDTVLSDWGDRRFLERYWPADLKRGDYSSETFKKRLVRLIEKMGKAWDNDPRVAYIEMGLIGWWGEQHSPSINAEMQKLIGDAFTSAFRNKLIMVRQARDFTSFPFGSYWDSFAHASQSQEAEALISAGDKWKTMVRGGEVAYDWGDMTRSGTSPDVSLKVRANRDYIIDNIRLVHCNHLGWINNYNHADDEVLKGAEEVQKVLGYRFILEEVNYTPEIKPRGSLTVSFFVRNTGSSPFYYNWPVEVSILNSNTKQPVWKAVFPNVDIRTWLPGDRWDTIQRKYLVEPVKYEITGKFKLPGELPAGEYILALSVLDPSGNVPSVRFAAKNYFKGGRHPIGKIGVNTVLKNVFLDETIFDDLYSDRTLYYKGGD
jgi:hypothetical protein